jgi:hypothetical protein
VDVERTMEFILEQLARTDAGLARTEAGLARTEAGLARTEANLARAEARQARTDAYLTRAIRAGVKEARQARLRDKVLDEKIADLAAGQRELQASIQAFIDSMRGGNGRH